MSRPSYEHLGRFSDWVDFASSQDDRHAGRFGDLSVEQVRQVLGFDRDNSPIDPRTEGSWAMDGVIGEEVSWSVGYGPRTTGWLLRPGDQKGPLPGVVALLDHGGFKFFGKEKIADGP
jgi:hypothetical protein